MHSGKAIIACVFDELQGHSSAGCNEAVCDLVKYLKGNAM